MMGWVLRFLVMFIGRTLRWRVEDPAGVLADTPPRSVIFATWHNRLFLVPYLYRKHWRFRQKRKLAVMVSASKDGEKLVRVLEKCDLICVRGSSSRRGKEALLEMTRYINEGYDAGITPDGPRGPKYRVATGVISLAHLTGASIVPVMWSASWRITLKSWDGFIIPLPFGRATIRVAMPFVVSPDDDHENKRLELETILKSLSES